MTSRIGVITFPGTLDDVDAARAVRRAGAESVALWHADHDLRGVDAVVVPGGFSYGDYLRAGAIARFSPVMEAVAGALVRLGVAGVADVRQGKHFELEVDDAVDDATLHRIAGELLANPVIEDWVVTRTS